MERLKSLVILFLMAVAAVPACRAAYVVHSVRGNVLIVSSGSRVAAEAGMKVSPADNVVVPEGASIEILNDINNTIYSSTTSGEMSFTRLMLDAKALAADNSANINSRLNFAGRTRGDKNKRVYSETGMVKRSQSTFDPEASGISVDPGALARVIAGSIRKGECANDSTLGFTCTLEPRPAFTIENRLDSPVYFNVLLISEHSAEISPLGLPSASFVLLPGQTLSRSQNQALGESGKHFIVATHYSYDVDALLDELAKELSTQTDSQDGPELRLPVFIVSLNQ